MYKINKDKLQELFSKSRRELIAASMNTIGSNIFFVVNNEIQKISNESFKTVLSVNNPDVAIGIYGRHEKDMFISTRTGAMHYNGENTLYMFEIDDNHATVFRSIILENDVFFLVRDNDAGTNLIYHGTLTENEEEEE